MTLKDDMAPADPAFRGNMNIKGGALKSLLCAIADEIDAAGDYTADISIVKHLHEEFVV